MVQRMYILQQNKPEKGLLYVSNVILNHPCHERKWMFVRSLTCKKHNEVTSGANSNKATPATDQKAQC